MTLTGTFLIKNLELTDMLANFFVKQLILRSLITARAHTVMLIRTLLQIAVFHAQLDQAVMEISHQLRLPQLQLHQLQLHQLQLVLTTLLTPLMPHLILMTRFKIVLTLQVKFVTVEQNTVTLVPKRSFPIKELDVVLHVHYMTLNVLISPQLRLHQLQLHQLQLHQLQLHQLQLVLTTLLTLLMLHLILITRFKIVNTLQIKFVYAEQNTVTLVPKRSFPIKELDVVLHVHYMMMNVVVQVVLMMLVPQLP